MLYSLLVGGLAGWLTGKLIKGEGFGFLANIIIGLIGGLIGGWVFSLVGISTSDNIIGHLITGIAGAAILVYLLGLAKR